LGLAVEVVMVKTWEFRARVTLNGVLVYVEAETEAEARKKVLELRHVDADLDRASWADVEVTGSGTRVDTDD
jgi:hypothetical protein